MSEQASKPSLAIEQFAKQIIEGVGGLNDFERYELAVPHVSDRVWAAIWTIKCLANPKCEGSAEALAAILERRNEPAPLSSRLEQTENATPS